MSIGIPTVLLACTLGGTITVPTDQPTIAAAVASAEPGDIVQIEAGTYYESSIFIGSPDLTISGATNEDGSPAVTIDGGGISDILLAVGVVGSEGATIENIVFTGSIGNALWIYHMDPTVRNCVFTGIVSKWEGAAIWSSDSEALIENCRFAGNNAGESGTILFNKSISGSETGLLARNCLFEDNLAHSIANVRFCNTEFQSCTFRNNIASAAISSLGSGGIATVSDTLFCGNDASAIEGPWNDGGGNQFEPDCPADCLGDVTGDSVVDVEDLLTVIGDWDDPWNVNDLLDVIGGWGTCN